MPFLEVDEPIRETFVRLTGNTPQFFLLDNTRDFSVHNVIDGGVGCTRTYFVQYPARQGQVEIRLPETARFPRGGYTHTLYGEESISIIKTGESEWRKF